MIILFSIILFHLLAIWAGRNIKELNFYGIVALIFLTLSLVLSVLFGVSLMENPEANH